MASATGVVTSCVVEIVPSFMIVLVKVDEASSRRPAAGIPDVTPPVSAIDEGVVALTSCEAETML